MSKPIIIVVGTRPAAIKSIPVYFALKNANINVILCATFQHDDILQQVFDIFQVSPDVRLDVMKKDQDLFYVTTAILEKIRDVYKKLDPSLVLVHGDTATAFASALAAFYLKIPIGHLEAGLRTGNIYAPFPEEIYRKYISQIAQYHFAPTSLNVGNLLAEGIDRKNIFCTGNVVVDALFWMQEKIKTQKLIIDTNIIDTVLACKKNKQQLVLLTAHRRESFDGGLVRIFKSIKAFALNHPDVFIFYPVHPNPNVLAAIKQSGLDEISNIVLSKPVPYKELVYLIISSDWIITDSGGIQEEGMSLGKKVLILRDVTERIEGVWEGLGLLVGTNEKLITAGLLALYSMQNSLHKPNNIYGDGKASQRIALMIKTKLDKKVKTYNIKHV